jgi:hypothetical protein
VTKAILYWICAGIGYFVTWPIRKIAGFFKDTE